MKELSKKIFDFLLREKVFSLALMLYIAAAVLLNGDGFNSLYNINNLLIQVATFGIVALGMTFALIGGEFDLSVGSVYSLTGLLVVGLEPRLGLFSALIFAIGVAVILGLLNGVLVAKAKISAFIVTFGAMIMVKGIALSYSNGRPITSQSIAFNNFGEMEIGGISVFFIIFVFLLIICHYVLAYTRYGRNIYAIGGNKETAITSGINVDFYKMTIFILTGFLSFHLISKELFRESFSSLLSLLTGIRKSKPHSSAEAGFPVRQLLVNSGKVGKFLKSYIVNPCS